jgi:hypothetical protein
LSGIGFALSASLSPYRNFFAITAIILLVGAHYLLAKGSTNKLSKIIVWAATFVTAGVLSYSYSSKIF